MDQQRPDWKWSLPYSAMIVWDIYKRKFTQWLSSMTTLKKVPPTECKSVGGRGGIFAKGKFFANNFHLKQIEIIWQQRHIAVFPLRLWFSQKIKWYQLEKGMS